MSLIIVYGQDNEIVIRFLHLFLFFVFFGRRGKSIDALQCKYLHPLPVVCVLCLDHKLSFLRLSVGITLECKFSDC